jgi:lipopolysaccharide export LptBFGC system permease protein LptF
MYGLASAGLDISRLGVFALITAAAIVIFLVAIVSTLVLKGR